MQRLLSFLSPDQFCLGLHSVPYRVAPIRVMGIDFPNRIGLAAGFDKNGECVDGLSRLGFGFIEVGTVTPLAQPGSARPRLFRLEKNRAIINRMGFNNLGVESLCHRIRTSRYRERGGIVGVNIGKNLSTPIARAVDDYLIAFRAVYNCADYITVNISSPNTENLRELQYGDRLDALLLALKQEQMVLAAESLRYIPLVVKVSPDISPDTVSMMSDSFLRHRIDGLIATNTTVGREGLYIKEPNEKETGGLSGEPLGKVADNILSLFAKKLNGKIPLIATGGVMCANDAKRKLELGASLVQVYTGLIYGGLGFVRDLARACS